MSLLTDVGTSRAVTMDAGVETDVDAVPDEPPDVATEVPAGCTTRCNVSAYTPV
jgi:hypothetical protein